MPRGSTGDDDKPETMADPAKPTVEQVADPPEDETAEAAAVATRGQLEKEKRNLKPLKVASCIPEVTTPELKPSQKEDDSLKALWDQAESGEGLAWQWTCADGGAKRNPDKTVL